MNLLDSQTGSQADLSKLEVVTRRSAVSQVTDQLRDLILGLEVGAMLPSEAKLAATLGVSRPVVREALGSLRAVGLVASSVGRGWRVVSNNAGGSLILAGSYRSEDLNEVRIHVEVPASGYAALRHRDGDIERLRAILVAEQDAERASEAVIQDAQFHIGIAQCAGNPLLVSIIQFVRSGLEEQSRALSTVHGRSEQALREHSAILEAIEARDARAAQDAMRAHLNAVSGAVCSLAGAGDTPGADESADPSGPPRA